MLSSNSLLARARAQVSTQVTTAGNAANPTMQDALKRIASLESRLAALERILYVGADGTVLLYATNNLVLYAEKIVDVGGGQDFSVTSPQGSIQSRGAGIQVQGGAVSVSAQSMDLDTSGTLSVSAQRVDVNSSDRVDVTASQFQVDAGSLTFNSGTVTASGVMKCDTLIANNVTAAAYSPGAGNIW